MVDCMSFWNYHMPVEVPVILGWSWKWGCLKLAGHQIFLWVGTWQTLASGWCLWCSVETGPCRPLLLLMLLLRTSKMKRVLIRPATIHWCTGASWYFLPRYKYRILNKLSRYLRYICIYASTNMGKHCLQLVLTLLLLFSPFARQFSEQTDKKNQYWAVFSIIFKMVDTTNTCTLPTRLVSCKDFWAHEQDTRWQACYATYHIVYRIDNCIGGKMYHCRLSSG